MPADISKLVGSSHTAVVTSEVQRGVIGDRSRLPELAAAAGTGMSEAVAALCSGARESGVPVVHCTAYRREDGRGANHNARLFGAMAKLPPMLPGTADVEVVPEIGVEDSDIVLSRMHGLSPMAGTDLDPILRNLGVTTVVAVGVSANVAITNLAFDAVNAGYDVVIPRDAVTGVPESFVDDVFRYTLSIVATVTTTTEVLACWSKPQID